MEFLQSMEQRYLRPVVIVESSPLVDEACQRNGLDFVQMLRPYSAHSGMLYARTGERGDSVSVRNFGVRLVRPTCVQAPSEEQILRHQQSLLRESAGISLAFGEQLDRTLQETLHAGTGGVLPRPMQLSSSSAISTLLERAVKPWHGAFLRDLHYLIRCSSFDTMDHPIGIIYAVSTGEVGGAEGLLRVFREQARCLQDVRADMPCMESDIHHYYIIVHDMSKPAGGSTLEDARNLLTEVQKVYGTNYCALLKINSVVNPQDVKCLDPSMWVEANRTCMDIPSALAQRAYMAANSNHPAGDAAGSSGANAVLRYHKTQRTFGTWSSSGVAKITGCCLSPEDTVELSNIMSYYLCQSLFTYVERKLRSLDVSVQDRRTTTLGKLAAWLKVKDDVKPPVRMEVFTPRDGSHPMYMHTSLEMQMRRCGDISLALRDFEGAAKYYKMCIDELVETSSQRPYNRRVIAGCQEGIGIAHFFLNKLTLPSVDTQVLRANSREGSLGAHGGPGGSSGSKSQRASRLEIGQQEYVAVGQCDYALRASLLLYEYSRTRTPPAMGRAQSCLVFILRSGLTTRTPLYAAVVNDMLSGLALFMNPPYPAGMQLPPTPAGNLPVYAYVRFFARHTYEAGRHYLEAGASEEALGCYLRVLEVFRALGDRGFWPAIFEHTLNTISQLYTHLGLEIKGLVFACCAVTNGCRLYSHPVTGLRHFEGFWRQQRRVLEGMGYALCPHMPIPCIVRSSFTIDTNFYNSDAQTDAESMRTGEDLVNTEWRATENCLRIAYNATVLKWNSTKRFPRFRRGTTKEQVFCKRDGGNTGAGGGSSSGNDNRNAANDKSASTRGGASAFTASASRKHYTIPLGEPLHVSFTMRNSIGGTVVASELSILYLAKQKPQQLWKSSATQTVSLCGGESRHVSLAFDPLDEGEYVIIGLCWIVLEQEGYYYFATREGRTGCAESIFEYAIEHPMPAIEAAENVWVTVTAPQVWLHATFVPPLPKMMRDGEYFHTTLKVRNNSAHRGAAHIALQRSPNNAHLIWVEGKALHTLKTTGHHECSSGEAAVHEEKCEDSGGGAISVAEHLRPGESAKMSVVVRAQHNHGDASISCINHIFLLLAYLSDAPATDVETASTPTSSVAASTVGSPLTTASGAHTAQHHRRALAPNTVRLHRVLRRYDVKPVLALFSTVMPPSNASLATAAAITAKHIGASSSTIASTGGAHQPVRVCRITAVQRPCWRVRCAYTGTLLEDRAVTCVLPPGGSLTLPLLIERAAGHRSCMYGLAPSSTTRTTATSGGIQATGTNPLSEEKTAGKKEGYVCTACLPLAAALPSEARAAAVSACLGDDLSTSAMNQYFMATSFRGAGSIGTDDQQRGRGGSDSRGSGGGASSSQLQDGYAFYLDKAGEAHKTEAQLQEQEALAERRLYGDLLEQYPPVAVAVSWIMDEPTGGGEGSSSSSSVKCGQLFHFIDPLAYLDSVTNSSGGDGSAESGLVAAAGIPSYGGACSSSLQEQQRQLCHAMLTNTTVYQRHGVIAYHVGCPAMVEPKPVMPLAAVAPLRFRCLSLAPVPVLLTVAAARPCGIRQERPNMPLVFVGRTRHSFLLTPGDTYEVSFTAHIMVPGLVDCNVFDIQATPLLFQPSIAMVSGMSRGDFVDALVSASMNTSLVQRGTLTASFAVTGEDMDGASARTITALAVRSLKPLQQNGGESVIFAAAAGLTDCHNSRMANHTTIADRGRGSNSSAKINTTTTSAGGGNAAAPVLSCTDAFIAQLRPRDFLPSQLVVLGYMVPAITNARFCGTVASSSVGVDATTVAQQKEGAERLRQAAAAVSKKAQQRYAQEVKNFMQRLEKYEASQQSQSGERTRYVYRPPVKRSQPHPVTLPLEEIVLSPSEASAMTSAVVVTTTASSKSVLRISEPEDVAGLAVSISHPSLARGVQAVGNSEREAGRVEACASTAVEDGSCIVSAQIPPSVPTTITASKRHDSATWQPSSTPMVAHDGNDASNIRTDNSNAPPHSTIITTVQALSSLHETSLANVSEGAISSMHFPGGRMGPLMDIGGSSGQGSSEEGFLGGPGSYGGSTIFPIEDEDVYAGAPTSALLFESAGPPVTFQARTGTGHSDEVQSPSLVLLGSSAGMNCASPLAQVQLRRVRTDGGAIDEDGSLSNTYNFARSP